MTVPELTDALEGMVWQFGYRSTRGRNLRISTGGLSALEYAFRMLGWKDPHNITTLVTCDVAGCYQNTSSAGPWPDDGPYVHLCPYHSDFARYESPPPVFKRRVWEAHRRRCKICHVKFSPRKRKCHRAH